MATNTLTSRASGEVITEDFFNDFLTAFGGDVVGRNSSGVPASGQNLGTASLPWGTGRFNSIVVGGNPVDTSLIESPQNRVVSGQVRSTSNQPAYLKPNGAANSLLIEGGTTSLVLDVNGTAVTVSSNLSKTGLTTGPSSNHTALVNDVAAAGQEDTRTWGEYPSSRAITVDAMGSNITSKVGTYQAFKIVSGANTEYFMAFVESTTKLSKCFRGFFYDSTYAPKNRIKFSDNDTITIMSLGWVFVQDNATTVDVSYNPPKWDFTAPASPVTGDYWYDIANSLWKRYDGASFVSISRTLVGMVVLDSSNAVAARSWDFYKRHEYDNTITIEKATAAQVRASQTYQRVVVNGEQIRFENSLPVWDITGDLATSADMYNGSEQSSTRYYMYVKDTGETVISDISPYWRSDLYGWYQPHNPWRCVGYADNDTGSNFKANDNFINDKPAEKVVAPNLVFNPEGFLIQRFDATAEATVSSGSYGFDRWYVHATAGTLGCTRETDVGNGASQSMRLKKLGSTGSFLINQVWESTDSVLLRGKYLSCSFVARSDSAIASIRVAVLGWTGTADSPTKNAISSYGSAPTYAASVEEYGAFEATLDGVNTEFNFTTGIPVGSSCNNIMIVVHTVTDEAVGDELNIKSIAIAEGKKIPQYIRRSNVDEIVKCQRYYEKSYPIDVAPGTSGVAYFTTWYISADDGAAVARAANSLGYKVGKRVSPPNTSYSPVSGTSGKARRENSAGGDDGDFNMTTFANSNEYLIGRIFVATADGNVGHMFQLNFTSDAEL